MQLSGEAGLNSVPSNTSAAYGDGCAEFYDEIYPPPPRQALLLLQHLAGGGAVLEAGVGTGRYAVALAALGLRVHGIDSSHAMLAAARRKAGGAALNLSHGDFSRDALPRPFRLVLCLSDTLALLPNAAAQARAIAAFAAALESDGQLLLETAVAAADGPTQWNIELNTQCGVRNYCGNVCPADPAQLDAWAQAAGLQRRARWRDWQGRAWNGEPGNMLSLYARCA